MKKYFLVGSQMELEETDSSNPLAEVFDYEETNHPGIAKDDISFQSDGLHDSRRAYPLGKGEVYA